MCTTDDPCSQSSYQICGDLESVMLIKEVIKVKTHIEHQPTVRKT